MEMFEAIFSSSSSSSSSSSLLEEELLFSSSDSEDLFALKAIMFAEQQNQDFIRDVVNSYSEDEFRRNFRVTRETALKIAQQFKNSKHYHAIVNDEQKPVSAEAQCLAFLWFAGNRDSYSEVSILFNNTVSAAQRHIANFLEFLFDISTDHIKFPTSPEDKFNKSREFAQVAGFPNVLGCIAVCRICIRNQEQFIRLQAICDANHQFLDASVCSPSKIQNSLVYNISFISKKLADYCGDDFHVLGEDLYPIREYLLTPYNNPGRSLTTKEKKFNKKHCQTIIKIEKCLNVLKQRFRQLIRLDTFTNNNDVEPLCKFVLGCCVLHNLCIIEGDVWDNLEEFDRTDEEESSDNVGAEQNEERLSDAVLKHLGELKRHMIADSFY